MSFKSIDRVLNALTQQPGWEEAQRLQHLLKIWSEVVEPAIVAQTRPTAIIRNTLKVATASPVWVQELQFKRFSILKLINSHLPVPLIDIRFSTAQWHNNSNSPSGLDAHSPAILWQNHPSRLLEEPSSPPSPPASGKRDPQQAFQQWAHRMQVRSHNLPLCPQCQSPTPPGELQRWSVCALCATHQWKS